MLKTKEVSLILIISLLLGIVSSCGSSSNSSESEKTEVDNNNYILHPQTTVISGPLGKAYTVIERKYKAKKNDLFPSINVEIELSDSSQLPTEFNPLNIGAKSQEGNSSFPMLANFIVEFLDEDGDIIETKEGQSGDIGSVLRLSQGERASVKFYLPYKHESDVKYFRIKSDYYPNTITGIETVDIKTEISNDSDEEFDKAMEHATKAMETTTKMMENIIELTK